MFALAVTPTRWAEGLQRRIPSAQRFVRWYLWVSRVSHVRLWFTIGVSAEVDSDVLWRRGLRVSKASNL